MAIAVLKLELEDTEPPVCRVLEVPLDIRLDRLHLALQAAMGWKNQHLYDFTAGRSARWAEPDPDFEDDMERPSKATLADLLAAAGGRSAFYTYDFGDDWRHRLTVAGTHDPEPGVAYPRLTGCTGRCPPEDVGGMPGFEEFLRVMADPSDAEHEDLLEWHGGPFDPAASGSPARARAVQALAQKWAPRKPG